MDLERRMCERGFGETLIERVVRLNPSVKPGERLRGLHLTRNRDGVFIYDLISKGHCIRARGRDWFSNLPKALHIKRGKRVYIARETYQDFG